MSESASIVSLRHAVAYAMEHSPFYQNHLDNFTLDVELSDADFMARFRALPFTTKEDISNENSRFLAVEPNQIAEFATTSGTSGEAVTIYLTKNDLARLTENERESLSIAGVTANDRVQLMTTIDRQFMAGLAYYLGVQAIGAGMIRIGPGVPALQWKSITDNQPTVLIAVPSFIISLIRYAHDQQIDLRQTSVKKIICIGESLREDNLSDNILAKRIREDWPVELYSTYASTEMATAFTECSAFCGGHHNPKLVFLEVIDENGREVANGELGEIVVTPLQVEGTPLIRYKTGDLARIYYDTCNCGRTTRRLGPILGRKNQMIKFKGTTLFPKAIFEIFDQFAEISCYKVEVSKDYLGNDTLSVLLESKLEHTALIAQLVEICQSNLRVVPHFVFLELEYIRNQVFKKHLRKPEKIVFK